MMCPDPEPFAPGELVFLTPAMDRKSKKTLYTVVYVRPGLFAGWIVYVWPTDADPSLLQGYSDCEQFSSDCLVSHGGDEVAGFTSNGVPLFLVHGRAA